jgi:hypothetical protein
VPPFDPQAPAHYWIVGACYALDPLDPAGAQLNPETLVVVSPACCYHCEAECHPGTFLKTCPGRPAS